MPFSSTQYRVIDVTLLEIQEYLVALVYQIGSMSPVGDGWGNSSTAAALQAEQAIGSLRQKLLEAQPSESKGVPAVPGLISV